MHESDGIVIGDLELRPHERCVLVAGHVVAVTCGELDILTALAEHPGWVLSADDLTSDPEEHDHSPESVSVLVSRLRQKLAAAGAPDVVETVRGFGYRLRVNGVPEHANPESGVASTGGTSAGEIEADALEYRLRDAAWRLEAAVVDISRSGDPARKAAVATQLERTLGAIDAAAKRESTSPQSEGTYVGTDRGDPR